MYVIGTAGHVDHGKSTLVKALTGIDPDRLQEEKDREMTIDLGFAWFKLPDGEEISVVDVPGHERFIKNMLAGVGGIDLAMLVVAADESVMPQTREHLAILDLLQVTRGLVALTKADLVEPDWLDLVEEEVRDALRGTTLEEAPMVRVSSVTGEGLDGLKLALQDLLQETEPRKDLGRPRLAVDRAFTMTGFGAVVTGTLVDGSLSTGQEVELVPSGRQGRIRGLQSHRQHMDGVGPGRRVAVNISGISHDDIQRGQVLTLRGWLRPTRTVDVRLRLTPSSPMPVKHNLVVTFHTGTSETAARVRLLDADELKPGQEAWAQVHLSSPVAVVKGDHFVIRSSEWTLGGGRIVDPAPRRHRRHQGAVLERLEVIAEGSPEELVLAALAAAEPANLATVVRQANLSRGDALAHLSALVEARDVVALGDRGVAGGAALMSRPGWERLKQDAARILGDYHRSYPLRAGIPREELRNRLKAPAPVFSQMLPALVTDGVLVEAGAMARAPEHRVRLTPEQERTALAYVQSLESSPFSPPTDSPIDPNLLGALADQGKVVRASDTVVFSATAYDEMTRRVVTHLREKEKITVADVRDLLGTSRKYALTLLEHLDQQHITRRVGDERVLMRAPAVRAADGGGDGR
jgi:selenocysteine-specific elongation factor